MNKILMTICGRGGSKGLPNKNIIKLRNIPLINWSIYAAESSINHANVDKFIVVDSDSPMILEIAKSFSKEISIHKRRPELAEDNTPKIAVLREVLTDVENSNDSEFDYLIDLDITSPIRLPEEVDKAFHKALSESKDVIVSVVQARRNPYFNMIEEQSDGTYALCKKSKFTARQQAPRVFEMNASIYVYDCKVLRTCSNSFWDLKVGIFEMKDFGILDIDSQEDFESLSRVLEYLYHNDEKYRGFVKGLEYSYAKSLENNNAKNI